MKHDVACGWSKDPSLWDELAAGAPEPIEECSICETIARVRDRIDEALMEYQNDLTSARMRDIVINCRILVRTA